MGELTEKQLREGILSLTRKVIEALADWVNDAASRASAYEPGRQPAKTAREIADEIHALYLEWLKEEGWRSPEEVQELRCESREWGIKKGR